MSVNISEPAESGFEGKSCKLKKFNGFRVFGKTEGFREDIGSLFRCGNVIKINLICGMNFSNIMKTGIDVFRARVIYVILRVI